jgi:hypothetical protein
MDFPSMKNLNFFAAAHFSTYPAPDYSIIQPKPFLFAKNNNQTTPFKP